MNENANMLAQWRADTPGCKSLIHLNNAGASLMPKRVVQSMQDYLTGEANEGGYEMADLTKEKQADFYLAMGKLLGCKADNIAFTSSATSSFARALSCIPFQAGDKILIATEDYISNQLAFFSLKKRFGIELIRAASLPEGGVDLDDFKKLAIKHKPRLVSLSHIPTNSGLVQPAQAVGEICRGLGITFLLDACQSVGQMPLDVNQLHCDFLSGTFRKFLRGPRGAGFLYVSNSVLQKKWEPLFIDMRGARWTAPDDFDAVSTAQRFEEWEIPYALLMGAKVATEYALNVGLETIQHRNQILSNSLGNQLQAIGLSPLDKGKELGSIITVHLPNWNPSELLHALRKHGINTSISQGEFALIDFKNKNVPWALRLSPHYFNTQDELNQTIDELKSML